MPTWPTAFLYRNYKTGEGNPGPSKVKRSFPRVCNQQSSNAPVAMVPIPVPTEVPIPVPVEAPVPALIEVRKLLLLLA